METSRGDRNLLVESLQLLPDGITALELNSFCTDGAMPALARFTALHQLELTGNAMEVDWARPAAQAVMPLLRTLCLLYINYETPPCLVGGYFYSFWDMPSSATSALTAASRLERFKWGAGPATFSRCGKRCPHCVTSGGRHAVLMPRLECAICSQVTCNDAAGMAVGRAADALPVLSCLRDRCSTDATAT